MKVSKTIIFGLMVFTNASFAATGLETLIDEALQNSPYIKMQERNIDAKKADVQVAWSPFLPHTQAEVGRGRQSDENYYTKLQKDRFNQTGDAGLKSVDTTLEQDIAYWNVTVKQDIFKGFGNYHNLKEKKRAHDIAELELLIEKNNLIYNVIETTIQLLNLRNRLSFLEKAKESAEEHSQNTMKRFQVQSASKNDVEKSEEKVLELDWKETETNQALDTTQNRLNQLLGRAFSEKSDIGSIQFKTMKLDSLVYYLKLISQNLEFQKINTEVEKNRFAKRKTYAQHLMMPNVGFEFNYEDRGSKFTDLEEGWKFGFFLRAPIFDGLENFGEQKKARAELESNKAKSTLIVQSVEIDVKRHYFNHTALQKKLDYLKKKREREQRIFDDTRTALKNQAATISDLHAAEVQVMDTEMSLIETKRNQFLEYVGLKKSTGEINPNELF